MPLILSGQVDNLAMDAYNPHPSFRGSLLRACAPENSPRHIWWESYLNPNRPKLKGSNITTGLGMHLAMEDYEAFKRLEVLPTIMRTGKPGKIGGAARGQVEAIEVLRSSLLQMREIQEVMAEGKPETSFFADEETMYGALPVRCRPDHGHDRVEIHWKTVSRMDYLGHHINRMGYMESLSFYRRVRHLCGLPPRRQKFYFLQTYAPYEIRVIEPSAYFLDEDSDAWKYGTRCLNRFKQLLNQFGQDIWPDYRNLAQDVFTAGAGSPRHAVELPYSYDKRLAA